MAALRSAAPHYYCANFSATGVSLAVQRRYTPAAAKPRIASIANINAGRRARLHPPNPIMVALAVDEHTTRLDQIEKQLHPTA
jgi:hypothetical protein